MIIVTGGSGFIGSNLIADLNALGYADILVVDDLGTQGKWKNLAKRRFADIIHYHKIADYLPQLGPVDAVFHMGANSSTTSTDGDEILAVNLRASMAWWDWCYATRTPFIYASSAATYGSGEQGFNDDEKLDQLEQLAPLNLYGWSKHAFDKWIALQLQKGKCPPQWAGLKFFNVYGPNEYHKNDMQSLVAKNAKFLKEGQVIKLFKSHREGYTDGGQLRDFVYVKDCTAVMLWLFDNPHISGLFNLGTGQARSFLDLITSMGQAMDIQPHIEYIDMPLSIRPNYQYFTEANMSKLKQAGYTQPFFSLEAGVKDYLNEFILTPSAYR